MAKNTQIEAIERALKEVQRAARSTIPRAVAKMAAEHFQENFRKGGFVNGGLKKWPEVKRRNPSSSWYGFEYKGDKRTFYKFKRNRKTGLTTKSKSQKKLNYSPTATRRGVLTSKRNYLMNSIKGRVVAGTPVVRTDAPHAQIHNEGGAFKVFGKHSATMPKRQFIGPSKELNQVIEEHITNTVNQIFSKIK